MKISITHGSRNRRARKYRRGGSGHPRFRPVRLSLGAGKKIAAEASGSTQQGGPLSSSSAPGGATPSLHTYMQSSLASAFKGSGSKVQGATPSLHTYVQSSGTSPPQASGPPSLLTGSKRVAQPLSTSPTPQDPAGAPSLHTWVPDSAPSHGICEISECVPQSRWSAGMV